MSEQGQLNRLIHGGIVNPNGMDWQVIFRFVDGTSRKVRLSPGRLSEEQAVEKAKAHCRIFDETIVDKIEAQRVDKSVQVVANATVHKATPATTTKSEKKKEAKNDTTGGDD